MLFSQEITSGSGLPASTLSTISFNGHGLSKPSATSSKIKPAIAASADARRTRNAPFFATSDSCHDFRWGADRLLPDKFFVKSACGNQFFMRTTSNHAAMLEHDDAIRPADCRHAMCDGKRRASFREPFQRFKQQRFGAGIECRSWLIED